MIEKPLFCLPIDLGTIATGNERAETPAVHQNRHKSPGLVWRTNGSSNAWARGQLAAAQVINLCSMVQANAQAGTTIRLRLGTSQAQVDGGSAPYDSGAVAFIDPAEVRESNRYHSLLRFADVTASWWRIDIGNHTGDFEAMSLVLGDSVQTERFYDRGWELGTNDLGNIDFGRWGVAMETDGFVFKTTGFKLSWLSQTEFDGHFRKIMQQTKRGPVWILFNPEAVTGRQEQFSFGRFGQPLFATSARKAGRFIMEFAMQSMI